MGLVVTTNATILCAHGGRVTLTPRQTTVTIQGGPVLRETDLVGAPILGCAQVAVRVDEALHDRGVGHARRQRARPWRRAACPCTRSRSRG